LRFDFDSISIRLRFGYDESDQNATRQGFDYMILLRNNQRRQAKGCYPVLIFERWDEDAEAFTCFPRMDIDAFVWSADQWQYQWKHTLPSTNTVNRTTGCHSYLLDNR